MLSALMPARDGGLIVRVYEAAGKPADAVKLHFTAPVASVSEVNLMEDRLGSATLENNSIGFSLRPFEIKTFHVQLGSTGGE
jgi:alpha-mannosidase